MFDSWIDYASSFLPLSFFKVKPPLIPAVQAPVVSVAPTDKRDSQDIGDTHTYLQECWPKLKQKFEQMYPGYTLKIAFTWRSVKYQQELYQQGRRGVPNEHIITNCDGIVHPSYHNYWPSLAVDVLIYRNGVIKWADSEYDKLTPLVQELGLVHGATWTTLRDPQHVECPSAVIKSAASTKPKV